MESSLQRKMPKCSCVSFCFQFFDIITVWWCINCDLRSGPEDLTHLSCPEPPLGETSLRCQTNPNSYLWRYNKLRYHLRTCLNRKNKPRDSELVCFAAPFLLPGWPLPKRLNDLWNIGSYQAAAVVHSTEIRAPAGFCQHEVQASVSAITFRFVA